MDLPPQLRRSIEQREAVLFLGAGASVEADHPDGMTPPLGEELSELLNEEFLGGDFGNEPLERVSELAINEAGLDDVEEFIRDIFIDFEPSDSHKRIARIPWQAIVTTNYDLVLEKAYSRVDDKIQDLKAFSKNSEPIEKKLDSKNSLAYIKLHGCISEIYGDSPPLVMSTDSYSREERSRLFTRFTEKAYEYSVVFIGHNLYDKDIRKVIKRVDKEVGNKRPMHFIVRPDFKKPEERFWISKRITPIECTFGEFIKSVDENISKDFRQLAITFEEPGELDKELQGGKEASRNLVSFVGRDVTLVHEGMDVESVDPKAFYSGYSKGWGAIERGLDVRRDVEDALVIEELLIRDSERAQDQEIIALKGHAGSGKSVLMKRIAWVAARNSDRTVLYKKKSSAIDLGALHELANKTSEGVVLFIDNTADNISEIKSVYNSFKERNSKITIVTAERYNRWNQTCRDIEKETKNEYGIDYLDHNEIEELIDKLDEHNELGYLRGKDKDEQIDALKKRAGRQLLVALHEATRGKPFVDIIKDEFESIKSERSRQLYITVSIFYRLDVKVRAGVISRIHGIPFNEFKEELYEPLEFIVFDEQDEYTGTNYYRCRHPHISEILFQEVVTSVEERFDHYREILSSLDIGFVSDRKALRGLMKAKDLIDLFPNADLIEQLYDVAIRRSKDSAFIFQQRGIFEKERGNLEEAIDFLRRAEDIDPRDYSVKHSLAETQLDRAQTARSGPRRDKYLREAKRTAQSLLEEAHDTSYAYHTLLKIAILELKEALREGDEMQVSKKTARFERLKTEALGEHPGSTFLIDAETKYKELVHEDPDIIPRLQRAFEEDKSDKYISLRLSETYKIDGNYEKAINVLEESIEYNEHSKDLHFRLAKYIVESRDDDEKAEYHFRKSYTSNDSNYEHHFWHARQLFVTGNVEEAYDIFERLERAGTPSYKKKNPREPIEDGESLKIYRGRMSDILNSYAFIDSDIYGKDMYTHKSYSESLSISDLSVGDRVHFCIAFTYRGPVAINLNLR